MCSGPNSQLWLPAVTALLFQLCLYCISSVVALKKREKSPWGAWLRNNLLQSTGRTLGSMKDFSSSAPRAREPRA